MELIDHFLSLCGERDPSEEAPELEALKRIVDAVASVSLENGEKFVCLKDDSVMRSDAQHAECNGNITGTPDSCVNGNPDNGDQTGEESTAFLFNFIHLLTILHVWMC